MKYTVLIMLAVTGAMLYCSEFGSRSLQTKNQCEALGYHDSKVSLSLEKQCVTIVSKRTVIIQLDQASAKRPGEIDG